MTLLHTSINITNGEVRGMKLLREKTNIKVPLKWMDFTYLCTTTFVGITTEIKYIKPINATMLSRNQGGKSLVLMYIKMLNSRTNQSLWCVSILLGC